MVSGSSDGAFRIWDVKRGETNAKMIATSGLAYVKIWDANTGELLKTINRVLCQCLAWTSDGKTLLAGEIKIVTAIWTVDVRNSVESIVISLSPNDRILATKKFGDKTVELWNTKTNQPIGIPLRHGSFVNCAAFSADGKFLVIGCDDYLCTWDVSAIIKEAGLPSDIVDVTPRPASKIKGAPRIPPGFFDDELRKANSHIRLSQSHGPYNHPTTALHRFSPSSSFWRRSKRPAERDTRSRSRPFSLTWNLSGILRRRNRSDIQLREIKVSYTAGKPRNYHARKKAASSSQLANTGTAPTTGTISSPRITVSGWRAHLVGWLCCVPIQNTNDQL